MAIEQQMLTQLEALNNRIGNLEGSFSGASRSGKDFSNAQLAINASVSTGVDSVKELNTAVDDLRKNTLVKFIATAATAAGALDKLGQNSSRFISDGFKNSLKTVSEFENSIALANSRISSFEGGMESISNINKKYTESMKRVNESTKLTQQQTEALFATFTGSMQGLNESTDKTIGNIEKIIIRASNLGLTFEETRKRIQDVIGIMSQYDQMNNAITNGSLSDMSGALVYMRRQGEISAQQLASIIELSSGGGGSKSQTRAQKISGIRGTAEMTAGLEQKQQDASFMIQQAEAKNPITKGMAGISEKVADIQQQLSTGIGYVASISNALNVLSSSVIGIAGTAEAGKFILNKKDGSAKNKAASLASKAAGLVGASGIGGGKVGGILGAGAAAMSDAVPVYVVNASSIGGGGGGDIPYGPKMPRKMAMGRKITAAKNAAKSAGKATLAAGKAAAPIAIPAALGLAAGGAIVGKGLDPRFFFGDTEAAMSRLAESSQGSVAWNNLPALGTTSFLKEANMMKASQLNIGINSNKADRIRSVNQSINYLEKSGQDEKANELRAKYKEAIKKNNGDATRVGARKVAKEIEEVAKETANARGEQMNWGSEVDSTNEALAKSLSNLMKTETKIALIAKSADAMKQAFQGTADIYGSILGAADLQSKALETAAQAAKERAKAEEERLQAIRGVMGEQKKDYDASVDYLELLKQRKQTGEEVSDEEIKAQEEVVRNRKAVVDLGVAAEREAKNVIMKENIDAENKITEAQMARFEQGKKIQQANIGMSEAMLERNEALRLGIGVNYEDTVRVVNEMKTQVQLLQQQADLAGQRAQEFREAAANETDDEKRDALKAQAVQMEVTATELRTEATRQETAMLNQAKSMREGYLDALESTVANMGAFAKIMPGRGAGNQFFASTFSLGAAMGTTTPAGNAVTGSSEPLIQTMSGLAGNINDLTRVVNQMGAAAGEVPGHIYGGIQGKEGQLYGQTTSGALAAGNRRNDVTVEMMGEGGGAGAIKSPTGMEITMGDGVGPVPTERPAYYGSPSDIVVTVRFAAPGGKDMGSIRVNGNGAEGPPLPIPYAIPGSLGTG